MLHTFSVFIFHISYFHICTKCDLHLKNSAKLLGENIGISLIAFALLSCNILHINSYLAKKFSASALNMISFQ